MMFLLVVFITTLTVASAKKKGDACSVPSDYEKWAEFLPVDTLFPGESRVEQVGFASIIPHKPVSFGGQSHSVGVTVTVQLEDMWEIQEVYVWIESSVPASNAAPPMARGHSQQMWGPPPSICTGDSMRSCFRSFQNINGNYFVRTFGDMSTNSQRLSGIAPEQDFHVAIAIKMGKRDQFVSDFDRKSGPAFDPSASSSPIAWVEANRKPDGIVYSNYVQKMTMSSLSEVAYTFPFQDSYCESDLLQADELSFCDVKKNKLQGNCGTMTRQRFCNDQDSCTVGDRLSLKGRSCVSNPIECVQDLPRPSFSILPERLWKCDKSGLSPVCKQDLFPRTDCISGRPITGITKTWLTDDELKSKEYEYDTGVVKVFASYDVRRGSEPTLYVVWEGDSDYTANTWEVYVSQKKRISWKDYLNTPGSPKDVTSYRFTSDNGYDRGLLPRVTLKIPFRHLTETDHPAIPALQCNSRIYIAVTAYAYYDESELTRSWMWMNKEQTHRFLPLPPQPTTTPAVPSTGKIPDDLDLKRSEQPRREKRGGSVTYTKSQKEEEEGWFNDVRLCCNNDQLVSIYSSRQYPVLDWTPR